MRNCQPSLLSLSFAGGEKKLPKKKTPALRALWFNLVDFKISIVKKRPIRLEEKRRK
jgi:hypothetical protein